ncbi:aminotransferase [Luteipulveratus halotolerans]|uniref:Aminotransferase n=1 Tax=Luteipulveratus halotolerans TaxID=1631356 RepID=A0A0L6CGR7_9MICO|nr:aminotransferase [Luteipulveratus halotolerans]
MLLVQNAESSGPGLLTGWVEEAGLAPQLCRAYDGEPVPTHPGGHAAVVLLGGGLLPDEDDRAPWLADERRLAQACLDDGTPLLGICLGGQLLAHVGGGRVEGNHGLPEKGVTDITLTDAAADDPLLADLAATVPAVESHRDAITMLPSTAVWLARSERCPHQAFRLGERAWGTQFHPEVGADRIAQWNPDDVRELGFDPDDVLARAREASPELERTWHDVVHRFLTLATA